MSEKAKDKAKHRASNLSYEEICVSSEFVRMHKHQLFGTKNKAQANVDKVKAHYWKMASAVLVENGGQQRSWKSIRKKWQNIACEARAYHRECNRTGRPRMYDCDTVYIS